MEQPSSSGPTIQLRLFTVSHLKEVLRRLSTSTAGLNKEQLCQRIARLLKDDRERATKAVVDVYRAHYAAIPGSGSSTSTGTSDYYYSGGSSGYGSSGGYSQSSTSSYPPSGSSLSQFLTPPTLASKILNYQHIESIEKAARQGLAESCRVTGATIVDLKHPKTNRFLAMPLTKDEINGIGKDYRLIVRFMLYDPSIAHQSNDYPRVVQGIASLGPWKFCPIWPKECRLTMNGETVFDTFTKNRLGMTAVGFKEPTPAIDVSDRFISQRSKSTSSSFDISPIAFEYSVAVNASHMRWIVVASVLKKKQFQAIVSETLQRSPTLTQCTQRVVRYFTYGVEDGLDIADAEVSLKDPASMGPMKIAARGLDCLHLQCFDLYTFLGINESSRQPSWKCPLCGKNAEATSVLTDSWFQNILDTRNKEPGKSFSKAKVHPDGRFTLVEDEPDDDDDCSSSDDESARKMPRLTTSITPLPCSPPAPSPPIPKSVPKHGTSKADAIELLDDDDILY